MSLDGVFEDPGGSEKFKYGGWTMPFINDEFMNFKMEELKGTDILLLGRITYQGFAEAWPKRSGDEFSDKFNSMPKYVVTDTLLEAAWNNSHIIKGDVVDEIKKLKQGEGGDIVVHGSGMLARFLLDNKLVDEISILLYPVILGIGKKLFEGTTKTDLKLVESRSLKTGVVLLRYQPQK